MILNFDMDIDWEYNFPVRLQDLIDAFKKSAGDAPEGATVRCNAEAAIDMIMDGPLGDHPYSPLEVIE